MVTPTMPRKTQIQAFAIIAFSFTLAFYFISFFRSAPEGTRAPGYLSSITSNAPSTNIPTIPTIPQHILHEQSTTPALANATVKAELGRSSWNLLHTIMSKFPLTPTASESESLKAYIYLFARLYPCGDCARHFQDIIARYPPQVGGRKSASMWACFVHNEVNRSLGKEMFDCGRIGEFYDCGCGGEEEGKDRKEGVEGKKEVGSGKEEEFKELELDRESGLTRGG